MHAEVGQTIGRTVVGELALDGQRLWVAPWGRALLRQVSAEEVQEIERALQGESDLTVRRVALAAGMSATPGGPVAFELKRPNLRQPYTLQVGTAGQFELLERRFWLWPDMLADVTGAYLCGIHAFSANSGATTAFARLAKLAVIDQHFNGLFEAASQDSQDRATTLEEGMYRLVAAVQRAAELLPWTLRKRMNARWLPPASAITPFSPPIGVAPLPVLAAALGVNGGIAKQLVYRQNPRVAPSRDAADIGEIQELKREFSQPDFHCVIGCSSSVGQFLEHFPRYRPPIAWSPG